MNFRTSSFIALALALPGVRAFAGAPLALPDPAAIESYRHLQRIPRLETYTAAWRNDAQSTGATAQDEQVHQWMMRRSERTSVGYAELCYGADGWRQLLRAAMERATLFADPPYATARRALWCPVNLPCRAPGTPRDWYGRSEMRSAPVAGNSDAVPVAGVMVNGSITNGFGYVVAWSGLNLMRMRIRPEAAASCRAYDAQGLSYALPCVGVVIHRNTDYSHEMAHFFNFALSTADAAWKEFLPAYHALKVHAHTLGIDLGVDGGWATYQARYDTAEAIDALAQSAEVALDGVALLSQYLAAGPDADVRRWCESSSVGRMVL